MSGPRRFEAGELGSERQDELDDALFAAKWLDEAASVPPATPSSAFGDRVMAAIAEEPTPSPTGFLAPLRRRGFLSGFGASVRQAWASVGAGRPALVRASAMAYVLVVVVAGASLVGVGTLGVAGALGVFRPAPTPSPLETPGPTIAPVQTSLPEASPEPPGESAVPEPSESDEPSESPEGSDDHGGDSGS
ncbi:MAG: hypothetical protein ABI620_07160, partial [Chloroflexota bacterium]